MIDIVATLLVVLSLAGVVALRIKTFDRSVRDWVWLGFVEALGFAGAMLVYLRTQSGADALTYAKVGGQLAQYLDISFNQAAPELVAMLFQQPSRFDPLTFSPTSNSGSMYAATAWLAFLFRSVNYAVPVFVAGCTFLARLTIFKAFTAAAPDARPQPLFFWTVLFPSVVYWTSSLVKESFCVIGMGILFAGWTAAYAGRWIKAAFFVTVALGVISLFRAPALPPLALGLGAYAVVHRLQKLRGADAVIAGPIYLAVFVLGFGAAIYAATRAAPNLAPNKLAEALARQHGAWAGGEGGSNISDDGDSLPQSPLGLMLRLPRGLLNSLFRPQLFDVHNIPTLIGAIEMTAISWIVARIAWTQRLRAFARVRRSPFLLMCALVTVVGFAFVGLVTLNIGSLSRYRVPFLPFYGALLAVLAQESVVSRAKKQQVEHAPTVTQLKAR